jgi:putative flippase GtrA
MKVLWRMWQQHRWLRFLVVGGMNTAFGYGVYVFLVFLGVNFAVSNLCSLVLGILFSFHTQGTLVFKNSESGLFLRYVAMWSVLYLSNTVMIGSLIKLGADAYSAGALAIIPNTVISFFLQKRFIFSATSQK